MRIVGKLNEYSKAESARIEMQDWFTEWTELDISADDEEHVVEYARHFWFGE